jgi:DNA-directed RNA polymerase subunit F
MAKKTTKGKVAAEIVAGLATVGAVAAAGYYFYGSKQAERHRGAAVKWAADMKKEVMREAKRLKKIDAKEFAKIVDTVTKTYLEIRSIDAKDVKRAASELKSNWEVVAREAKKSGRKSVSSTMAAGKRAIASSKKTVKGVAKNAVTKAKKTARKSR